MLVYPVTECWRSALEVAEHRNDGSVGKSVHCSTKPNSKNEQKQ